MGSRTGLFSCFMVTLVLVIALAWSRYRGSDFAAWNVSTVDGMPLLFSKSFAWLDAASIASFSSYKDVTAPLQLSAGRGWSPEVDPGIGSASINVGDRRNASAVRPSAYGPNISSWSDAGEGSLSLLQPVHSVALHDGLLCAFIALAALVYSRTFEAIHRTTGLTLSQVCCVFYVTLSISIDLCIKNAAHAYGGSFPFEPACSVIVVEYLKLIVSVVLFVIKTANARGTKEPMVLPRVKDVGWLSVPAFIYAINNLIVFQAIRSCPLPVFGVVRETTLIWNALLWSAAFGRRLCMVRWLAIFGIFLGCTVNQISAALTTGISAGVSWAFLLALTTAAGAVANEYAMKQRAILDINLQNSILYMLGGSLTLAGLALLRPERVKGPGAFFVGFVPECWRVIILQVVAGLLVSRVLKYLEAVTKSIVAALRGPGVVFVGAALFGTPLSLSAVLSTFVVSVSCFAYLREGSLATAPAPAATEPPAATAALPGKGSLAAAPAPAATEPPAATAALPGKATSYRLQRL